MLALHLTLYKRQVIVSADDTESHTIDFIRNSVWSEFERFLAMVNAEVVQAAGDNHNQI